MIRFPLALGVVLLLVSCSTGYKTAPANLDDACSIMCLKLRGGGCVGSKQARLESVVLQLTPAQLEEALAKAAKKQEMVAASAERATVGPRASAERAVSYFGPAGERVGERFD